MADAAPAAAVALASQPVRLHIPYAVDKKTRHLSGCLWPIRGLGILGLPTTDLASKKFFLFFQAKTAKENSALRLNPS